MTWAEAVAAAWLCRHGVHLWRRGERDKTGRRTWYCRVCNVIGV